MVIKEAARSLHTACSCVQPSETARAGHSYGHDDHKLGGVMLHTPMSVLAWLAPIFDTRTAASSGNTLASLSLA